jgi:hypothetical protein
VLIGFRAVYVFDYAQTEGVDLPELNHAISGDVGDNRDRLLAFLAQQNIALEFNERIAPALGVSYGGKIALLPGQSKAEEFTTLVHETAHELLHKAERRTFTTATVRETEAESVAFIVGQAVGLEMGSASSDYIQLYHGNASLLAESLEVIQRTASIILRELHDELDAAVFNAYGWPAELTVEEILGNIVSLNAQRSAEERAGIVRWLRPEFQAPNELLVQATLAGMAPVEGPVPTRRKQPWPSTFPDQVRAVKDSLRATPMQNVQQIAAGFKPASRARVAEILETLTALGQTRRVEDRYQL